MYLYPWAAVGTPLGRAPAPLGGRRRAHACCRGASPSHRRGCGRAPAQDERQTRVDPRPKGRALTPLARGPRPAAALRFTRRAVLCPPRCSGTILHTRAVNDTRGPILGHLAAEATDRPAPSRLRASGRAVTEKARTSDFGVRSARRCPDARNGVPSRRTRRLTTSRIRDDRVAEVRRRRRALQTMAPQRSRPGAGGRDRRDTIRPTLTHQGHVLVRRLCCGPQVPSGPKLRARHVGRELAPRPDPHAGSFAPCPQPR